MNKLDGTFGSIGKGTWKPWKYESRVNIANQVDKFKKSLAKQIKGSLSSSWMNSPIPSLLLPLAKRVFVQTIGIMSPVLSFA